MLIFILIHLCLARFYIHSPSEISSISFNIGYANFGNPGLYSIYGRIQAIPTPKCELTLPLYTNSIPLLTIPNTCDYSELAYNCYLAGAEMVLFTYNSSVIDFRVNTKNYTLNNPNIVVLLIPENIGKVFTNYSNVWVSYANDPILSLDPVYSLFISGNHESDYLITSDLMLVNNIFNINSMNFTVNFIYQKPSDIENPKDNCLVYESQEYCLQNNTYTSGSEILKNVILIINFYNYMQKFPSFLNTFFYYIEDYYLNCMFNYSLSCNLDIMRKYINDDVNIFDIKILTTARVLENGQLPYTYYLVNDIKYSTWGYGKKIYCLSSLLPLDNCGVCGYTCPYQFISSPYCYSYCNTSSCGYNKLSCLAQNSGCYYFMLNDNNCNPECKNESDCKSKDSSTQIHLKVFEIVLICLVPLAIIACIISICYVKRKYYKKTEFKFISQKTELIRKSYNDDLKIFGEKICIIDFKKFINNEDVVITPCKHGFHPGCLKEWLEISEDVQIFCPTCKRSLNNYFIR
ncbi:hypothetical protein SteCoe_35592 [Stentor coeruleus]|uniref:RING-type domain-containing protein n=1 Tax=Stentor coeruleus TaxID=5963 RepID=A0A1R2ARZ8_9CILI|nr:hypothetical protein SteCoe_35592 [Stentor coeruleus]